MSTAEYNLPSDWTVTTLGEIADLRLGRTPPRNDPAYWIDGRHPWVSIADLNNSRIESTKELVSDLAWREILQGKVAPAGTLLLSFKLTIGKVGILEMPAAHNEAIAAVIPDSAVIDRDFLFYKLQKLDYDRFKDAYVKGSTLSKKKLQVLPITLPPIPEQRAIMRVLRTVQRAKEVTDQVIVAARELKKSLMRHLFTYGPLPPLAGDVAVKDTDFGAVPEHWDITPLSKCSEIQTGVAKGRRLGKAMTIEVPYLRVANVQDGYLDLREVKTIRLRADEFDRFALQAGDIVLTEGGDFDKLGRGHIWQGQIDPCVHQNHIFAVRPNPEIARPHFVSYLVQSPYAKRYFLKVAHRTTNLASINKTKLGALPALLPPIEEQMSVVNTLESIDRKISAEVALRDALATLFDSLLHDLMTARLRVRELEAPSDRRPSVSDQ